MTRTTTTVNLPTGCAGGLGTSVSSGSAISVRSCNDARGRNVGLWRVPACGGERRRLTDPETIDLDDGRTRPLLASADGVLGATLDRGRVRLVSIGEDGMSRELIGGERCVTDYDRAGDVIVAVVTDATSAGEVVALRDGKETKLTDSAPRRRTPGSVR